MQRLALPAIGALNDNTQSRVVLYQGGMLVHAPLSSVVLQQLKAGLTSIGDLTTVADRMLYTTGADAYATTALTPFARTVLDDADAETVRSTLELVIGTDVQAYSGNLATLAGITPGTAGQAILADALVDDVRDFLDVPTYVTTLTALKALDTTKDTRALFGGSVWTWTAGDFSTHIAADTLGGIYAKADAIASTSGAWVRDFDTIRVIWFGTTAAAFNVAAAVAAVLGRGTLDMRGRSWSYTAPIVVNGSYITIDATDGQVTFDQNTGSCVTFGDGTTQRNKIKVIGGRWAQENACLQYLFDIRYVRHFTTKDIQTANLYSYARWGQTGDAAASYKWYESDCEINLRWPDQATGHANCYDITNSAGGWYQNNITFEGREGTDNDAFRTSYAIRFLNFVPTRFDHWMATNVIGKGFTFGIHASVARLVNIQWPSMRIDDCRNSPFFFGDIDGIQGTLWAGGTTSQIGTTFNFVADGSGTTMSNIDARLQVDRATQTLVEIAAKNSGTVSAVSVRLMAADWRPDAVGRAAIQVLQSTSGTLDGVTVSATAKVTSGSTPTNGIAKFGTTTNVVAHDLNIVGCTNVANFSEVDGVYTPTLTSTTNVDATTAFECRWTRTGAQVTVSGWLAVDPTAAAGASTVVGVSLPIASNFSTTTQLAGTAASSDAQRSGAFRSNSTADRAELVFSSERTTNTFFSFSFTYQII